MALEMHTSLPQKSLSNPLQRLVKGSRLPVPFCSQNGSYLSQNGAFFGQNAVPRQRSCAAAAIKEPEIETVEEIENNVENQSTESLYARFDSLLDQTMQDYNLGDRITGTVAR